MKYLLVAVKTHPFKHLQTVFLCKELRALTEAKTCGLRPVKIVAAEIGENPSISMKSFM